MSTPASSFSPAEKLDLYFRIQRAGTRKFTFVDGNGAAIDISSFQFALYIKDHERARLNKIALTVGSGLTVGGAGSNELTAALTVSNTVVNEGEYYWELYKGSTSKTYLSGKAFAHWGRYDGVTSESVTLVVQDGDSNITIQVPDSGVDHYRGLYVSLVALQTAIPTGNPGDYADVDAGVGSDVQRYIWDDDDSEWVAGGSAGGNFWPLDGNATQTGNVEITSDGWNFTWGGASPGGFAVTGNDININSANAGIELESDGDVNISGTGTVLINGSQIQPLDADLTAIAALSPSNDDILQRKAGAWTNRTLTQVRNDLAPVMHVPIHANPSANVILTNQPNTEQNFNNEGGRTIRRIDATNYSSARVAAQVEVASGSANTPRLYLQYTTDLTAATGWTTIGSGTGTEIISMATTGIKVTTLITLPAGAKADVLYRVAQNGGDATADPSIGQLSFFLIM